MQVTYLYQSGFVVDMDKSVLIFDYVKGNVPPINKMKDVYVFVSHIHPDHFRIEIMQLARTLPKIHFVLSDDLLSKPKLKFFFNHILEKSSIEKITWVKPGQSIRVNQARVKTLKSTDAGVAYLVKIEDKTIFHAGDLNAWTWEKNDKNHNDIAQKDFENEIDKLKEYHIDIAFFPVDPRQESHYTDGINYLMTNINVDKVYPMHFQKNKEIVNKLLKDPITDNYRDKIENTPYNAYQEETE